MKHVLSADLTPDEWRAQFAAIREGFVALLDSRIGDRVIKEVRACDEDGTPTTWRFEMTDSKFLYHETGSIEEARGYLRAMIDEGWRVAFAADETQAGMILWLTRWESDRDTAVWPEGISPIFEEIHHGIIKTEQCAPPNHRHGHNCDT